MSLRLTCRDCPFGEEEAAKPLHPHFQWKEVIARDQGNFFAWVFSFAVSWHGRLVSSGNTTRHARKNSRDSRLYLL
jgi:hypothetical protein